VELVYDLRELSGVSTARPGVAGVCTHDAWVMWEGHSIVCILLTGCTDVVKRGRSWLGVDGWGCWSSKGVDCDIRSRLNMIYRILIPPRYTFFQKPNCKEL
jgi:hypothetical protein